MHAAGGSTPRLVSEWLALAQEHAPLLEAFRASHGRRLPAPQAFGLWLSERMGTTAGPLRLEGRHSSNKKAWRYRIVDYVQLAEVARQEAEHQAAIRAQIEEQQRQQADRQAAEVAALQAAAAERMQAEATSESYQCEEQRYAPDGRPLPRKILIDPRTGEPLKKKPQSDVPAAVETPATIVESSGRIPKILDGGRWREMTAEEIEQSRPRTEGAGYRFFDVRDGAPIGFADPGGVVSHQADTVYVCGGLTPWPRPS